MALQGLIYVNRTAIGFWSAQRITGEPGQLCTYKCEVGYHDPQRPVTGFRLEHHYDDGAIALAAAVLTRGAGILAGNQP